MDMGKCFLLRLDLRDFFLKANLSTTSSNYAKEEEDDEEKDLNIKDSTWGGDLQR